MYFSRISFMRTGVTEASRLAGMVCGDGYREHQSLWQLFEKDPDAGRDFLFRREQAEGWPRYFMISDRSPVHTNDIWKIESKRYEPKIPVGRQLAFSLRVNPVVTRVSGNGKRQRHDVVMDLKKQLGYRSMPRDARPPMANLIQRAGIAWLESRAGKHGFSFAPNTVQVDGYLRHRVTKIRDGKEISFSTLDYSGLLKVMDSELFTAALFKGIGSAKAFGCGLLLVRPAR